MIRIQHSTIVQIFSEFKIKLNVIFKSIILTHYTQSGQNRPDKFGNILLSKAFSGKHLKEKSLSEAKLQLSLKYFVIFKSMKVADVRF